MPVWHASVANGRPLSAWTRHDRRQAKRRLLESLRGVGGEPVWWESGQAAMHLRHRVTPAESEIIGPARDIRGTDEVDERLIVVACEVTPAQRWALGL